MDRFTSNQHHNGHHIVEYVSPAKCCVFAIGNLFSIVIREGGMSQWPPGRVPTEFFLQVC